MRAVTKVHPWVEQRAERLRYDMAHAAAYDAGNASMRANNRTRWSREDYEAASAEFSRLMPEEGQ